MSAKGYRMVLLGPPGAGKGTQAELLCETLSIPHVATGDLLRENTKQGTALGKEARAFMDRGELVPDSLVIRMVEERLTRPDASSGFLLDGYPRSLPQADALDAFLAAKGLALNAVLYMTAPDDLIVERLSGRRVCPKCNRIYHLKNIPPRREGLCDECGADLVQREDDKPETVRRRLSVYHQLTYALVDRYRASGLLQELDGVKDIEPLFREILGLLGAPLPPRGAKDRTGTAGR